MNPPPDQFLWAAILLALALALIALLRGFGSARREERSEGLDLQRRLEEIDRISSSLDELRKVFTTPHIRGGVGETLLEELIRNWLPEQAYSFQHSFKGGARADAVIRLGSYLVVVDSKFPLESVDRLFDGEDRQSSHGGTSASQKSADEAEEGKKARGSLASANEPLPASIQRSLIAHAKGISEKYIRPEEGTLQFAIMYIPSEAVYYRCFVRDSGMTGELLSLGVVPAGPYSLFLYIQTVAYGLRGFAFPRRARELTELSYRLDAELELLAKELATAGTHLKNLYGNFDQIEKRSRRLRAFVQEFSASAQAPSSEKNADKS